MSGRSKYLLHTLLYKKRKLGKDTDFELSLLLCLRYDNVILERFVVWV